MTTSDDDRAVGGPPALAEAFAALPAQYQDALWATLVEGRTPQEVAAQLGVPALAVSVLAFRAGERLAAGYVAAELAAGVPEGCAAVLPELPASARGALAADEHAAVRAHVDGCAGCRTRLAVLADLGAALSGAAGPAPSVAAPSTLAPPSRPAPPPAPDQHQEPAVVPVAAVLPAAVATEAHARNRRRRGQRWPAAAVVVGVLAIVGVAAANLAGSGGGARLTADERTAPTRQSPTSATPTSGGAATTETTAPAAETDGSTTTTTGGGGRTATSTTPMPTVLGGSPTTQPPATGTTPTTPTTARATTTSRPTTTTAPPTTVPPSADLSVDASYVTSSDTIPVIVANAGPDAAPDVVVEIRSIGAPSSLVSGFGGGGAGWDCEGVTIRRCRRSTVGAGGEASLVFTVATLLPAQVQVSVTSEVDDPNAADNHDTVDVS